MELIFAIASGRCLSHFSTRRLNKVTFSLSLCLEALISLRNSTKPYSTSASSHKTDWEAAPTQRVSSHSYLAKLFDYVGNVAYWVLRNLKAYLSQYCLRNETIIIFTSWIECYKFSLSENNPSSGRIFSLKITYSQSENQIFL